MARKVHVLVALAIATIALASSFVLADAEGVAPEPRRVMPLELPRSAGQPAALYSVVRPSGYNGPCLMVFRVSDGATRDIDFADNVVDRPSAEAFAGSSALKVAVWYDLSGNGHDLSQVSAEAMPTWPPPSAGAATPLVFDGNYNVAARSGVAITTRSMSAGRLSIEKRNHSVFRVVAPAVSLATLAFDEFKGVDGFVTFIRPDEPGITAYDGGARFAKVRPRSGQPTVVGTVWGPSAASVWLDGVKSPIGLFQRDDVFDTMTIGTTTVAEHYQAAEAAFAWVVYPAALSDADAVAVSKALVATGLVATEASTQLVFDGDSLTESFGRRLLDSYPKMVAERLSKPVVSRNLALFGQTQAVATAHVAERVVASFDPSRVRNVCIVDAGSNDLATPGVTASAMAETLKTYAAAVRRRGYKLVVGTILPRSDLTDAQDALRREYNAWLAADWGTLADGFADGAADPRLSKPNDQTYFQADGIHLNDAGYKAKAEVYERAVAPLVL